MAEYQVTSPSGEKFRVTGPDGATDQQVLAQVQGYKPPAAPAAAPAPASAPPKPLDPPDSNLAFVNQNIGKGIAGFAGALPDFGQNLLNLFRMGGDAAKRFAIGPQAADPNFQPLRGLPGTAESNMNLMRQAGLLDTRGDPESKGGEYMAAGIQGMTGAALGGPKVAPRQIPRLLTAGGTSGLAAQAGGDVLGPGGEVAGAIVPGARSMRYQSQSERATAQRQSESFGKARDMGIPVPPRALKTDKPQQALQDQINAELKQPPGTAIDPKTLQTYRNAHWGEYENLINSKHLKGGLLPNKKFQDAIKDIAAPSNQARGTLPQTFKSMEGVTKLLSDYQQGATMQPKVIVRAIKKLRSDATSNLSAEGPEAKELGMAQRKIALALEDLIEDNLASKGGGDALAKYREARTAIAKSHDVESSLDPVTRQISGARLSQLMTEGRPLTGKLADVAEVSGAFPSAVKAPPDEGQMFAKKMSPYGMTHPGAVVMHAGTRWHDPLTMWGPYQKAFVDPRNKLSPDMERALRAFLAAQQGNRAGIPPPPE